MPKQYPSCLNITIDGTSNGSHAGDYENSVIEVLNTIHGISVGKILLACIDYYAGHKVTIKPYVKTVLNGIFDTKDAAAYTTEDDVYAAIPTDDQPHACYEYDTVDGRVPVGGPVPFADPNKFGTGHGSNATVYFTPGSEEQQLVNYKPEAILVHELVHALRDKLAVQACLGVDVVTFEPNKEQLSYMDREEFYAVTIANIFSSSRGYSLSQLQGSYRPPGPWPKTLSLEDFLANKNIREWLNDIRMNDLIKGIDGVTGLKGIGCQFNPFFKSSKQPGK